MSEAYHFAFYVSYPGTKMPPAHVGGSTPAGECIVGEPVTFAPKVVFGECRIEIIDAPQGSVASAEGSTLIPDLPGVYSLRIHNGSACIDHRRVAFPAAALEHPIVADALYGRHEAHVPPTLREAEARRLVLRKIAGMARRQLQTDPGIPDPDATVTGYSRTLVGGARFDDHTFARLNSRRPIPAGLDTSIL